MNARATRLLAIAVTVIGGVLAGCIDDPDSFHTDAPQNAPSSDDCPEPLVACGGQCVDHQNDPRHCGNCNNDCDDVVPDDSEAICIGGDCNFVCTEELTRCGQECVDVRSSPQHCGGCDSPCAGECVDGICNEMVTDVCEDVAESLHDQVQSGDADQPYIICTAEQFDEIREFPDSHFRLMSDIDLAGAELVPFEPIDEFGGVLNGSDHVVSDLEIDEPEIDGVGLFRRISETGRVTGLEIVDAQLTGGDDVGIIAGIHRGMVSQVTVQGVVSGQNRIGAAIGHSSGGRLQEVTSEATVEVITNGQGSQFDAGGVVGRLDNGGWIDGCDAAGSVAGDARTGGVVGAADSALISDCDATGEVSGYQGVGGLAGHVVKGAVIDSSAHTTVTADDWVGGLVGYIDGNIADSTATGTSVADGSLFLGGMAGRSIGTIENSTVEATVSGTMEQFAGGMSGHHVGTIDSSVADAEVSADAATGVGGLVGESHGSIIGARATGEITGASRVGGLVGYLSGDIADSSAEGDVEATGGEYAGGLVGRASGTVSRSMAAGDVEADYAGDVGGLLGRLDPEGHAIDSFALGDVTGADNVGGLVGRLGETLSTAYLTNVYSVGAPRESGEVTITDVGGLVGTDHLYDEVSASYWDRETSGTDSSAAGESRSTAEFADESTFWGWDFDDVWRMPDDDELDELPGADTIRPRLQWEFSE